MAIRVLLVDDHEVVVQGFAALLDAQADITVVGIATGGRAAIELVRKLDPDVVVMDVTMPEMSGIEATRQILRDFPKVEILGLSLNPSRRVISQMLDAGGYGYLLKTCAPEELVRAIKAVASGKTYLCADVTDWLVRRCRRKTPPDDQTPCADLSARQQQVLQSVAEGKSTKEIAAMLHVSVKTVESHRHHIMERLDVHSIAGLTRFAIREGLTPLGV